MRIKKNQKTVIFCEKRPNTVINCYKSIKLK